MPCIFMNKREIYIKNDTICLSQCIESDYRAIYDSWNEVDVICNYNWKIPHTFDEYCANLKSSDNWGAVIIRLLDDKLIGRIGISSGLPDLTITIFEEFRAKQLGTMAFALGVRYCFEVLGLDKIYAGCYEDNIASRKMIDRCGFHRNPDGDVMETHIITGEHRRQLDFAIENPLYRTE